jgi:hypothetical protein
MDVSSRQHQPQMMRLTTVVENYHRRDSANDAQPQLMIASSCEYSNGSRRVLWLFDAG